jgi:hypothetical protein
MHSLRFRPQRLYAGSINQLISFASHGIQKLRIMDANFKISSRAVFLTVSNTFITVVDLIHYVGFDILTAVVVKGSVFWDITPCSLFKIN